MKKFLSCFAVFVLLIAQGLPIFADQRSLDSYTASVDTYPVTESAYIGADISGVIYIHHIVISNNDVAFGQQVDFYELGDSTTTVTLKYSVYTGSDTSPIQTMFPIAASPWKIDDLLLRKSNVGSTVKVTIFYR